MEHFTSPLDCIKKLQDNFNEVTPEITQIFLSESIVANRKKVEDIVMSFDKYAEYFASLKDESIKIG